MGPQACQASFVHFRGEGGSSSELWPPTPASSRGWDCACGALLQSQVWWHSHSGDTLIDKACSCSLVPVEPWLEMDHCCPVPWMQSYCPLGTPSLGNLSYPSDSSEEAKLKKTCHSFCLITPLNLSVYLYYKHKSRKGERKAESLFNFEGVNLSQFNLCW